MLKEQIIILQRENREAYINNLETRMRKYIDLDSVKAAENAVNDRENVFISRKIFHSRKFYFKTLLSNLENVQLNF